MRAASVVASATIGFPRIGPRREVKAALEAFWRETKGAQSTPAASARKLWAAVASAEAAALTTQSNAGACGVTPRLLVTRVPRTVASVAPLRLRKPPPAQPPRSRPSAAHTRRAARR